MQINQMSQKFSIEKGIVIPIHLIGREIFVSGRVFFFLKTIEIHAKRP